MLQRCFYILSLAAAALCWSLIAQQPQVAAQQKAKAAKYVPEDHRPPLFLREDGKHVPADTPEHPLTQASISGPAIELKIYGDNKQSVNPDTGIWEIQR